MFQRNIQGLTNIGIGKKACNKYEIYFVSFANIKNEN